MKREQLINKMYIFLDTCSDAQLVSIDKFLSKLTVNEEFKKNDPPELGFATGNGNGLGREDADEGTWGSIYRSPENE